LINQEITGLCDLLAINTVERKTVAQGRLGHPCRSGVRLCIRGKRRPPRPIMERRTVAQCMPARNHEFHQGMARAPTARSVRAGCAVRPEAPTPALEMIALKSSLSEYTENEFLELIKVICSAVGTEDYQDELLENFIEVTGNVAASDWIYYPENGENDSPEGILQTVKSWRAAQGLTGFKGA
jgi:hypothetical protein